MNFALHSKHNNGKCVWYDENFTNKKSKKLTSISELEVVSEKKHMKGFQI